MRRHNPFLRAVTLSVSRDTDGYVGRQLIITTEMFSPAIRVVFSDLFWSCPFKRKMNSEQPRRLHNVMFVLPGNGNRSVRPLMVSLMTPQPSAL
jgi:hypothetical protein